MAQFPLGMGKPGRAPAQSTAIVPVAVDGTGQARFDAIVTAQHKDKVVHSQFKDLLEKDASKVIQERPDADAEAEAAARTSAALSAIVNHKISTSRPGAVAAGAANKADEAQIIRYIPDEHAPGYNPATKQRIIKMVEAPVDPLEPPKFKHGKVPGGPPDAPVPVMHSPTRKVTVADQQAWKIPPCVSNWKNARGYVVPLDKRVAADGRSLLEPTVNDNFAKLSEALLIAERKARVEVETRAAIQRKLALKAKEEKEAELRQLAQRARMERAGIADVGAGFESEELDAEASDFRAPPQASSYSSASSSAPASGAGGGARGINNQPAWMTSGAGAAGAAAASGPPAGFFDDEREDQGGDGSGGDGGGGRPRPQASGESDAEYQARMERERVRQQARKERERELRNEAAGRKSKGVRDADRDMSERIALGMPAGGAAAGGGKGGEAMYDARLFNQVEGMAAGFGGEDDYNVYDKAWRGGDQAIASAIYRPRQANGAGVLSEADQESAVDRLREGAAKRFKSDGADFEGVRGGAAAARSGPVEFERTGDTGASSSSSAAAPQAADPFGLDAFLTDGGKRKGNALDAIGKGRGGGYMTAAGGGATMDRESGGSGRANIAFTSSGHQR